MFYRWIRDLHLYLGLFISPFLIVFAVSVFFLVHSWLADAFVMLHKSPGPHLVGIRMNWFYMRLWRWFADGTVYLVVFLSLSGLYLWYGLRTERRIGLCLLAAGVISFSGIVYALVH